MQNPENKIDLKQAGRFGLKSFFGGCVGCLGAWVTTVIIILLASLIFGSVFYNSMVNLVSNLTREIPALLQGAKGPFTMGQSSIPPTPTGSLPALTIYATRGEDSQSKPISVTSQSESPQTYFWVKTNAGVNTSFILWITTPEGSSNQFGSLFTTRSDGSPRNCGRWGTVAKIGEYKIQAFIGSTIVGEFKFTVLPN
jgi:hypothetical protein